MSATTTTPTASHDLRPRTLDDEILAVQRMARCSRYWARAARAVAAEFEAEFRQNMAITENEASYTGHSTPTLTPSQLTDRIDLRSLTLDKEAEARNHDREAEQLDAVVQRLEEMRTVLESFEIRPPDEEGDVWFYITHQGDDRLQGAFNLGKPVNQAQPESSGARIKIAHNVASMLETARQSSVGDRP